MVPHCCMAANLDAAVDAAALDRDTDTVVSWLPCTTTWGSSGCSERPCCTGSTSPPQDFLAAPARWMEWMAEFGGTATAGPNFACALRLEPFDASTASTSRAGGLR